MDLTFEQKLQNYADLAVQIGVGLRAGQRLIIRAPVEAAPPGTPDDGKRL